MLILTVKQTQSVAYVHSMNNTLESFYPSTCIIRGPPGLWSYGSLIYNYLCNQCLLPPKLWVQILLMA